MKQSIWNHSYEVNSLVITTQKRIGLFGVLNLLQDIAWIHATHLGHGSQSMLQKKLIWALTRQKLVMHEWPSWEEKIRIQTWIRPIQGVFAYRDFEIFHGDHKIGECTTSWLTLDLITRKPKKLDLLDQEELHCRTDSKLELEAPKIVLRDDLKPFAQFQVRNSDLDSNDHVNNTRYAQWILDSIPIEWHKKFHLYEYEVNFLAETHLGNQITVLSESKDFQNNSKEWVQFQGIREKDQKMVFSARLQVSPIF